MSSDLVEDLQSLGAPEKQPPHKTCRVALILQDLEPEQRAALEPLLEPTCHIGSSRVAAVLTKWGYQISYNSIQRHRRRGSSGTGCQCQ